MKDSGVPWIGEIPEEWDAKQLKRDTSILRGASPRPIDDPKYFDKHGEYGWVRISDVTASDTFLETTQQKLSVLGSNLSVKLLPKDLFLSIAGSVGKPCIAAIPCCIHDGFVYFPRLSMNRKFLFYIFKIGLCFQGLGKFGTQLNLNTETVGNIVIPFPTIKTQKQIASYLDKRTKTIDNEIVKNQNLIKLLQAKRQSEINHSVTKGLDDSVTMKDSGIEWIGEIPEEWVIKKLKQLTTFSLGLVINPSHYFDENGTIPMITGKHVHLNGLKLSNTNKITSESNHKLKSSQIYSEDIVTMRVGYAGRSAVVTNSENGINCASLIITRCSISNNSNFICYVLNSIIGQTQTNISQYGMAQQVINLNSWKNFLIPLPSKSNQNQIVSYLDEKTAKIDSLISKVKLQITKLQEFRESLISSAVTGKIKVAQA